MGARFNRHIGIDYSCVETPESSCKGLRVYVAEGSGKPEQVQPPPSPRRYWTRRGLAEWLREELDRDIPAIVGIDHAFSFPLAYFEKYRLPSDWQGFLEDFHQYWPTDAPHTYVCFIREDPHGRGLWRTGERSWLRLTERWTATAKSVFGFGVQGEVATSTHAGLPWLLYLRNWCKRPIHFWPFDTTRFLTTAVSSLRWQALRYSRTMYQFGILSGCGISMSISSSTSADSLSIARTRASCPSGEPQAHEVGRSNRCKS